MFSTNKSYSYCCHPICSHDRPLRTHRDHRRAPSSLRSPSVFYWTSSDRRKARCARYNTGFLRAHADVQQPISDTRRDLQGSTRYEPCQKTRVSCTSLLRRQSRAGLPERAPCALPRPSWDLCVHLEQALKKYIDENCLYLLETRLKSGCSVFCALRLF